MPLNSYNYMTMKYPQLYSFSDDLFFKVFLDSMPPDPLASMLCMLIVLCTITCICGNSSP